ncbi:TAXI family TRAP transporter solute-binding subunit [Porticoccus sp. W117]|uniref:TAXI family TRAP transporter solute-binding subunit n=1 Tax=Porticoccus sp. W117 TaxID=3054777 RepID=UPI002591D077|nr:TAXI family TRAP transporter solute-binding subunit [Porticoccus sp. W117]MDM3871120.1 TAXI family TRAP transporter solute-binding subunit [Porticoccus sp. W117]
MKKFAVAALIAAVVALTGCSRGPDVSNLQGDLQKRLDTTFGEGLFKVTEFRRYGSQPLSAAENDSRDRIAIYYKADIELQKDHRFSDWSGQNRATLYQVLGSAEKGVEGVVDKGNQSGDVITAHGLSVYADDNDAWVSVSAAGTESEQLASTGKPGLVSEIDASVNPRDAVMPTSWQQRAAGELASVAEDLDERGMTVESSALRSGMRSLLTEASLKVLKEKGVNTLVSGTQGGDYYALGEGIEKAMGQAAVKVTAVASTGARDNLALLRQQLTGFAITQSDLAIAAYTSTGAFERNGSEYIRALASLYPEPVQILVRADAGIDSLANLAEKRVNIGPDGSGTQGNARQILTLAGVDYRDFSTYELSISVAELVAGNLDAVFVTSASPSNYMRGVGENIKLLPLGKQLVDSLISGRNGYVAHQIPAGTYPGVDAPVDTVAVTALLVADLETPDAQVEAVLNGLFDSSVELSAFGERGASLDRSKALSGVAIPLHPVAEKYYSKGE